MVFISTNQMGASRLEIDSGNQLQVASTDSEEPFVFVFEQNAVSVAFYDLAENLINTFKVFL